MYRFLRVSAAAEVPLKKGRDMPPLTRGFVWGIGFFAFTIVACIFGFMCCIYAMVTPKVESECSELVWMDRVNGIVHLCFPLVFYILFGLMSRFDERGASFWWSVAAVVVYAGAIVGYGIAAAEVWKRLESALGDRVCTKAMGGKTSALVNCGGGFIVIDVFIMLGCFSCIIGVCEHWVGRVG
jgi:hypothetical protein